MSCNSYLLTVTENMLILEIDFSALEFWKCRYRVLQKSSSFAHQKKVNGDLTNQVWSNPLPDIRNRASMLRIFPGLSKKVMLCVIKNDQE